MAWNLNNFSAAKKALSGHKFAIAVTPEILSRSHTFLMAKRGFLIDLIENPVLVEHEKFSDLLLALFHIMDEINSRRNFADLPQPDMAHIEGDFNRTYGMLILQWVDYLAHLKTHYPYLFSLAARQNPFNPDATPVIGE
ncbi:MAG: hypothetical protein HUN04_19055 [Desulfobacter sp.]|nr:MAG: hypothetical protein HUN04_19055 [Desulfobacter sp.]